jgi:hypothetical protein
VTPNHDRELIACLGAFRATFNIGKAEQVALDCVAEVERNTTNPLPLYRLARLAELHGRWELWKHSVALALSLTHDTPQSVYHRACAKRRLGDWSGWFDNEARHLGPWAPSMEPGIVRRLRWTSAACTRIVDLRDQVLLIVDEGGFGDSIQSLCFARPLAAAAKRVILSTKPELEELVRYNFGDTIDVVTRVDQLDDEFDEWIFSWSAPTLFDGIPGFEPLAAPHPVPRARFDARALQVGLCWAASDYDLPPSADRRSIQDLSVLEPLLSDRFTQWHSLQVGSGARDADRYPAIQQSNPPITTFTELANLIVGLDCVVTVDTAMAHLAGRLSVPTVVMLRCSSDDRWGFGDSTEWYPSARLVCQPRPGDWAAVVANVARQLHVVNERVTSVGSV